VRVLVTGATGFVGRHVIPLLLARGHQVLAVSRDAQRASAFDWFARVEHIAFDLHRTDSGELLSRGVPDALLHLAWQGLPNYKASFHIEANLPADVRLLGALVRAGVPHVLATGTCFEYGMRNGALTEDLPADPTNPYGIAKDAVRRYLVALCQERPFALQWARLFYTHGPGQNPNSLLAQLDRAIDAQAAEFDMSAGDQLRDYLPIADVATALVGLLERPDQQGLFNVCSGQPISVRSLVEQHLAARGAQIHLNLGRFPYAAHEPMAFWGDAQRLSAALQQPATNCQ